MRKQREEAAECVRVCELRWLLYILAGTGRGDADREARQGTNRE